MTLLAGFKVVQIGSGAAAAVCGRLLADVGAQVTCIDSATGTTLLAYLNHCKAIATSESLASADLIVREGQSDVAELRRVNPSATIVMISPYGETGPKADDQATDLTLFFASGIARQLTGQVDDLSEAPIRPVGEQSAFIGGLAAACAGMNAALGNQSGATIDVSIQETLATFSVTELARAGRNGKSWDRKRVGDGNGATVTILPASDGYVAISPREEKQWTAWLKAMGSPDWGTDPRFVPKANRVKNWDALHALMSQWSRQHDKQSIADAAQREHVPSFPLREVSEHLDTPQMQHRGYYRPGKIDGRAVQLPGLPFGLSVAASNRKQPKRTGPMPLSGVRVLDFSWVIAGPTTTRYLAAMGAEVIKIEAPSGDPGRATELHAVLGQAKKSVVLDLKKPEALEIARALAAKSDILIENYATGVMDRLGLGADALKAINPGLIYISASGMGRTGPEAKAVAYGTLLQCYAGFAGLNRHADRAPRVGLAWLDPMCGLMLAFVAAAALWHRQHEGGVARVDFSMIEAMLWTMAEPLIATQLGTPPKPMGNTSARHVLHGVWRCSGDDDWISIVTRTGEEWQALCRIVPGATDEALSAWAASQSSVTAAETLLKAGIPAAALARTADLAKSPHLAARDFWEDGLPGLPWRASFGRTTGPAPALGRDTDQVLTDVLDLSPERIVELGTKGAFG
ncbi:MAG TPA: CoA transferase [Reyranella sp.]|jgi:crotonobetainyl-CoA:carnitine CoA-transferase CaiB-like acyl-CoA transferase